MTLAFYAVADVVLEVTGSIELLTFNVEYNLYVKIY